MRTPFLILFFLTLNANAASDVKLFCCMGLPVSVPLNINDSSSSAIPFNIVGNLIVVKARVDTIEGNFILDTGSPYLVLNITYFRNYTIESNHDDEQTSVSGTGGTVHRTSIKDFSLGSLHYYNTYADLASLSKIENIKGIKLLGLLGTGLLAKCEMIIDYENNMIQLHRINKRERSVYFQKEVVDTSLYNEFPIDFSNDRITTESEIAGKKIKLIIDCAAELSILDSRLPTKIFEGVTVTRRAQITGVGNKKADVLYGILNQINIGNIQIDNMPILIINLESTCFSEDICVDGVLGLDFLSHHKLGFDFVKRKMYIWK